MKRIIILLIAAALILCACTKQPPENETTENESATVSDGTTSETQETVTGETASDETVNGETVTGEGKSEDAAAQGKTETTTGEQPASAAETESFTYESEWSEIPTFETPESTTLRPISEHTTVRQAPSEAPSEAQTVNYEGSESLYDLGNGILLLDFYSYSGKFVEDGTDEQVSNIAAIRIGNASEKDIQYGEITVRAGGKDYLFNVSTLLSSTEMIALECNRAAFGGGDITACGMSLDAEFTEKPDVKSDTLYVQLMNGIVNIKNISGSDINSTVRIYIKNIENDVYFGGITYRLSLDSIAAGEIKQLSASHVSGENSKVVFVTIAG